MILFAYNKNMFHGMGDEVKIEQKSEHSCWNASWIVLEKRQAISEKIGHRFENQDRVLRRM